MEFDVTIEIPKGHRNKYEVDHDGPHPPSTACSTAMSYPADYGYVEDSLGEDSDPLERPGAAAGAHLPGCMVRARPIGMFVRERPAATTRSSACRQATAPGAHSRADPDQRVRPARDPALLKNSTRTSSRADRRGGALGAHLEAEKCINEALQRAKDAARPRAGPAQPARGGQAAVAHAAEETLRASAKAARGARHQGSAAPQRLSAGNDTTPAAGPRVHGAFFVPCAWSPAGCQRTRPP